MKMMVFMLFLHRNAAQRQQLATGYIPKAHYAVLHFIYTPAFEIPQAGMNACVLCLALQVQSRICAGDPRE